MSDYDVVVVGAGPAGSLAAREAARAGAGVLLVERAEFPRAKVCGSCLNPRAVELLARLGMPDLLTDAGAVPLKRVTLMARGRDADLTLGGVAVARDRLDAMLADAARNAGVDVRFGTAAKLVPSRGEPGRRLELTSHAGRAMVSAGVVVAADGLGGGLVRAEAGEPGVAKTARLGAGALFDTAPDWCEPGRLIMAVGRNGYVGLVRLGDGRLDAAAAFDPAFVRATGLAAAANIVLAENGLRLGGEPSTPWRGTPALTQTPRRLAGERWFRVGDAAGYVEPFTGEGMTWALTAAADLGPRLAQPWTPAAAADWQRRAAHPRTLCRLVARAARSPLACSLSVRLLRHRPALARPVVARLGASLFSPEPGLA